jgi:hypothetical protein
MAVMRGQGWTIIVNDETPWPKGVAGKKVETLGMYNRFPGNDLDRYLLIDGSWRPVRLADQLGEKVELRGTINGASRRFGFLFRDIQMYIDNLTELPEWTEKLWDRPVIVRGVLEKAKLPRMVPDGVSDKGEVAEHYIIRKATIEPIDSLLAPERVVLDSYADARTAD